MLARPRMTGEGGDFGRSQWIARSGVMSIGVGRGRVTRENTARQHRREYTRGSARSRADCIDSVSFARMFFYKLHALAVVLTRLV